MFWADEIAKPFKGTKKEIWVDDMATPSGKAHVGTLRGAIIHDVAAKALKNSKLKAKYTFFSNDFDPMDGIPSYLDKKVYEKYMGMPMFMIPAPEGNKSFSEYYMDQVFEIMRSLGCVFKEMKDSVEYKSGTYDKIIKVVLDNAAEIRETYKEVSGSEKPSDWYPFQPICENCGKIGTTRAYDWDGKEVSYICEENMVEWAKGCGHKGKVSPFGGTGKMPWKTEWPAKWAALGIDVEGEGKDHASAGGSRDLANHLCQKVFKIKPPYDIPYEHIIFAGKKMSKSKGIGISAEDVARVLPPEIIRFVMVRNPGRVIDLNLEGMVIPSLYDEYDRSLKAFNKEIDFPDLAQTYYYSQVKEAFNTGYVMKFSKIAYAIQMPNVDIKLMAAEEKGDELNKEELTELEERIKFARIWLEKFAPEEFKFEVQKKLPKTELTKSQEKFLVLLAKQLETVNKWSGEEVQTAIYAAKEESGVEPKVAFGTVYALFLNKNSGPQAGWFLASLDKKFVLNRLKKSD